MPSWHHTAGLTGLRLSVLGLILVAVVGLPLSVASAEPSAEEVEEKVEKLNVKVEQVVEEYNQVRIELDDVRQRVRKLRGSVTEERKDLSRLRDQRGEVAAAAYRSGSFGGVLSVLAAEDPQAFVDRAALLETLARDRSAQLREYESKVARLEHRKHSAEQALKKQARLEKRLDGQKETIQAKLDEKEELLREIREPVYTGSTSVGGTYTGPATGSARAALEFAYAQLGKPYSWGAAGPSAYDCSGLTMAAWAAGGVSLPHSSQMQFNSGPHVARSDLQPGDLLFFGSPIHHVGIYAGNGQMVHAYSSGQPVSVDTITSGYYAETYVGAVRP